MLDPAGLNRYGPLLAGDMNGDGAVDLVMPQDRFEIGIWFNQGSGTFSHVTLFDVGGDGPKGAKLLDYDGDGDLDVAVACEDTGNVSFLENDGSGNLSVDSTVSLPIEPEQLRLFDEDGDGDLDVALSGDPGGQVVRNLGNGVFGNAGSFPLGRSSEDFEFADTNGDGFLDLLESKPFEETLTVAFGDPDGGFFTSDLYPTGLASERDGSFADFNGDGILDLVWPGGSSGLVHAALGLAEGSFGSTVSSPIGMRIAQLDAGDFNDDGNLDLIVGDTMQRAALVALGDGQGGFVVAAQFDQPLTLDDVLVIDLNDDGHDDFLAVFRNNQDSRLHFYAGDGLGSFTEQVIFTTDDGIIGLVAADVDGDGDKDLGLFGFRNIVSRFIILKNLEGGLVGDPTFYPTPDGPQTSMAFGDWDADGDLDLAVSLLIDTTGNSVKPYLNDGAGDFSEVESLPDLISISGLFSGDVDQDGLDDLFFGTLSGGLATVLRSLGDGSFVARSFGVSQGVRSSYTRDLNSDGRNELIFVNLLGDINVLNSSCSQPDQGKTRRTRLSRVSASSGVTRSVR